MSIFEKIVQERSADFFWESEKHIAFLDINPRALAHTLVIPKKNLGDHLFDLTEDDYTELMLAAREVAKFLQGKLQCDRVLMKVEGFDVPHVHIHLFPAGIGIQIPDIKKTDLQAIKTLLKEDN